MHIHARIPVLARFWNPAIFSSTYVEETGITLFSLMSPSLVTLTLLVRASAIIHRIPEARIGSGPLFRAHQACLAFLHSNFSPASCHMGTVWPFYIQHQFRRLYWAHDNDWDRYRAAMEGSSFYIMPAIFRWFSGNIGYHHIHHLAPRTPNYRLKQCYDEVPELQEIDPVPYISGLRNIFLSLWDEQSGKLLSFREAKGRITPC